MKVCKADWKMGVVLSRARDGTCLGRAGGVGLFDRIKHDLI